MSNENTPETPDPQDSGLSGIDPAAEAVDDLVDATESPESIETAPSITEEDVIDSLDPIDPVDSADSFEADDPFDTFEQPETFSSADETASSSYVPPQPPPTPLAQPVRRLVRDPYARLGGVSSGIAHHYGIDVSLVRLGFVLFTLFSGVGILLYILAWFIVPRAEYWPPAPPPQGESLSTAFRGRELAYGLLAVGILLSIFAGGGGAARLLISVVLVGAGVWMLVQPTSGSSDASPLTAADPAAPPVVPEPVAPVASTTMSDAGVPSSWQPTSATDPAPFGEFDDPMTSSFPGDDSTTVLASQAGTTTATAIGAGSPPVYTATRPVYVPNPVPRRRRRLWPLFLLIGLFLIPILFIAGIFALVVVGSEDGFNLEFDGDGTRIVQPLTFDDLPLVIDEGAGEIVIDLTDLDLTTISDGDAPRSIDIDLNAGEVTVEVPTGMAVNVDASVGAGDVTVFENSEDGIRPRVNVSEDDAVIDLDIRVGVGEVTVSR